MKEKGCRTVCPAPALATPEWGKELQREERASGEKGVRFGLLALLSD